MLGFMLLRTFALQLLLVVPALAQYVETNADGKTATVTLPLLFEGKNKAAIPQIGAADLQVSEDGVERPLKALEQRKPSDRLLLAVLLDSSNSQRSQFNVAKRLAQLTVNKLVRENVDPVAVGVFDLALKHTNFVTDKSKAVASFANVVSGGPTAIHDAIYEFTRKLTDPGIRKSNVILVLISDGDDNQSQHTLDEAIREAQQSNVTIFAIDTGLRPVGITADKSRLTLMKITQETGGLLFDGYTESDLNKWLERLAPALQNRSYATYEVATDGDRKRIEVRTSLKKIRVMSPTHRDSRTVSK